MRVRLFHLFAGAVISASAATASPIAGNGVLGDFTGDFSYDAGTRTISVSLTNAATTLPGGRLVAFAFNLPNQPGAVTGVTYSALGPDGMAMTLLGGPSFSNGVSVQPFGSADIGAGLGGSWLGGGNPNPGLAVGETGTYTFELSGDNAYLSTLTEEDFYTTLSTGGGGGAFGFLARFRGFDNGGSDKVPGGVLGDPDPPPGPDGDATVPEPLSVVTFTILGAGVYGIRRWRKKSQVVI